MRWMWMFGLCAVAGMVTAGCERVESPFDTTGDYVGAWSGTAQDEPEGEDAVKQIEPGDIQIVEDCPLSMTLVQNVDAGFPSNLRVDGTVTVDYACVDLPSRFLSIPPTTVNVGGFLQENGNLTLLSGGCSTGFCVVLTMDGRGEDVDGDGFMDSYAGDWNYLILLAGVVPFGFEGTFSLEVGE